MASEGRRLGGDGARALAKPELVHEMLEGAAVAAGQLLVDYTGRLFREGKATISRELSGIFDRLGSSAESWWARLEKLSKGRLLGRFFAASRDRLRQVATHLGVHHLANLGACPAR